RVGVHGPASPGRPHQGSHGVPDRPSALDRPPGSPDRGLPGGPDRGRRATRRAPGPEWPVPPAPRPPVLGAGGEPVTAPMASTFPLPRSQPLLPSLRQALLVGFFLALACSISGSQILLALLLLLVVPWDRAFRGAPGGLAAAAHEVWA